MSSTLKKISGPIRSFGLIAGSLYGIDQILLRAGSAFRIHYYEIMAQPISGKPLVPKNFKVSTQIKPIPNGDPLLETIPPPADVIEARFKQDVVCLGAFRGSELIGYQWICFGPYEEDEVRVTFVPLPADESVFDFDFYLFPKHRFGLGFVSLWDGANAFLRSRGIRYTCSRVSRFNLESRQSHNHLGAKCVGRTMFLSGRSFQLMIGSISPYFHCTFSGASKPLIEILPPPFDA